MSFEVAFILFISFITIFFLLMKKKRKDKNTAKLPPGPGKLPIIGNLHQLGKLPHRSLQNLSKTYGDLMFLQLGFVPALVVSSPDRAREIFKNYDLVFSGRPPLYALKRICYDLSCVVAAPYGDYWREIRKIVVLELMTAKRVQSFGHIRVQEVALMVERISSMSWLNKLNGVDKRINKTFQDLDRFFDKIIEQHRDRMIKTNSDDEDIIDVLLRIQKDPHQTIALKDEQIKGVLVDVFVAGTDTSAATIEWTMAELIRNPTVKEKAQQEVRKVAKGKAKVEETDLPKLTYLKLVIKESLRFHPPAPLLVPRETTERCTIDNKYEIPAKTRVFFNAAAISSDPGYWKNPERFYPERFVNSQVDFRGQHFELLPFGAGRRGCPGISFSIPLVELALANLLFCFDWELPEGMSAKDVDMEEAVGITMHKKTPLCLVASPVKE